MNILIVGLGEVGSHLAKVLSAEKHSVTVVDSDRHRLKKVTQNLDVHSVHGDGSRPDVLDRADADEVDLLLAVSNDDNSNMLSCLFGKRVGAKRTVLRVKDMSPFQGFRTFFRKNLMFDHVLSLEDLAATEIVKTIRQNKAVGVENFAEGKVQLRRLRLEEGSALIGVAVRDLKIPEGMLIAAIDRDHEVIIPSGEDVCELDDEILVVGEPPAIATFEKKTGIRATQARRVAMIGAGGTVVHVCQKLRLHGSKITVIAPTREDAERIATEVDGATVLHGDATDMQMFEEEGIGQCDAFLGLTDTDEINLMSCLLASKLKVPKTVALVQKPDYIGLYQELGVTVAVSPRLLCANSILGFVRQGSISSIATIEEGKAEVIELEIPAGSKIVGRTVADAGFPQRCVIGAIAREHGEILIPRGNTKLEALDNLVVFVTQDCLQALLDLVK
ncbi:MAG: Trk system potassium transporter TrkA [Planctomycetota bacterium]